MIIKRTYRKLTGTWRVALGVPLLAFSIFLAVIYMATSKPGRVHLDLVPVFFVIWVCGFLSRGITDALVDNIEGAAEDIGFLDKTE